MRYSKSLMVTTCLVSILLLAAWAVPEAVGQSPDPQAAPQVSAQQQEQIDQLKALEDQMQKDRDAVHAAINKFGWDSDQTDAAQEKLFQTRTQYRSLRRSLRSQGVTVPPPTGLSAGGCGFRNAPGARSWLGPRRGGPGMLRGRRHHWRGHCCGFGWR
jgi:hypothetical protein